MSCNKVSFDSGSKRRRVDVDSQGILFDAADDLVHWVSCVEDDLRTERRYSPMQLRFSEVLPSVRMRVDRGLNKIRQGLESLDVKNGENTLEETQAQLQELQAELEIVRGERDASKTQLEKLGEELQLEREEVAHVQGKLNKSRDLAENRHEALLMACREKDLLHAKVKELEEHLQQAQTLAEETKAADEPPADYNMVVAEAAAERQWRQDLERRLQQLEAGVGTRRQSDDDDFDDDGFAGDANADSPVEDNSGSQVDDEVSTAMVETVAVAQRTRRSLRQKHVHAAASVGKSSDPNNLSDNDEDSIHPVARRTRLQMNMGKAPTGDVREDEDTGIDDVEEDEEVVMSSDNDTGAEEGCSSPSNLADRCGRRNPPRSWEQRLDDLKAYKKKYKHLLVHQRCKEWNNLGRYVHRLRQRKKGALGNPLTRQQIGALDAIGFNWDGRTRHPSFEKRLEDLKRYKAKHGDLNVPDRYRSQDNLGSYVHSLRQRYRGTVTRAKLTRQEIAALESIGFVWTVRFRKDKARSD